MTSDAQLEPKMQELGGDEWLRPGVLMLGADVIDPSQIRWLWKGQLAAGKFQLMAGQPGIGKSLLTAAIAAIITTGGVWPDGTHATPGVVVIQPGEDDLSDTIVPRLIAAGADLSKVILVAGYREQSKTRNFDPASDFQELRARLKEIPNVVLVIVDPVILLVRGSANDTLDVRRGLEVLVEIAAETGAAVIGVSHFAKSSAGRDALERVIGSQAFAALPRLVHVVAKLPGEEDERILGRAKSNIGPDGGGFVYRIEGRDGTACITWLREVEGDVNTLLANSHGESASRLDTAKEWLVAALGAGEVAATVIEADSAAAGHSKRTLDRARKDLGVVAQKKGNSWFWSLGAKQGRQDCQPPESGNVGNLGSHADQEV